MFACRWCNSSSTPLPLPSPGPSAHHHRVPHSAGGTAKFPLVFSSKEMRQHHLNIEYCINASLFQTFEAQASVQPLELELSASELVFAFSLDHWDPHVDAMLTLDNPSRFPAEYEWVSSSPQFQVVPAEGVVKPQSNVQAVVRWCPPPGSTPGAKDALLTLQIAGELGEPVPPGP
jgi:hypothetical protein